VDPKQPNLFEAALISDMCGPTSDNVFFLRMRWAGNVARMGEKRNAYSILLGKPEGKRPLGRPKRR
jgi:hypothetical protein